MNLDEHLPKSKNDQWTTSHHNCRIIALWFSCEPYEHLPLQTTFSEDWSITHEVAPYSQTLVPYQSVRASTTDRREQVIRKRLELKGQDQSLCVEWSIQRGENGKGADKRLDKENDFVKFTEGYMRKHAAMVKSICECRKRWTDWPPG